MHNVKRKSRVEKKTYNHTKLYTNLSAYLKFLKRKLLIRLYRYNLKIWWNYILVFYITQKKKIRYISSFTQNSNSNIY